MVIVTLTPSNIRAVFTLMLLISISYWSIQSNYFDWAKAPPGRYQIENLSKLFISNSEWNLRMFSLGIRMIFKSYAAFDKSFLIGCSIIESHHLIGLI